MDQLPLTENERAKVINQYETFINEKLKIDLKNVLLERNKIIKELTD